MQHSTFRYYIYELSPPANTKLSYKIQSGTENPSHKNIPIKFRQRAIETGHLGSGNRMLVAGSGILGNAGTNTNIH